MVSAGSGLARPEFDEKDPDGDERDTAHHHLGERLLEEEPRGDRGERDPARRPDAVADAEVEPLDRKSVV